MYEMPLKEILQKELKKLSGLTWGQRLGYIWDYYKPLMVAVIVIISLISLGITVYHNLQINHIFQAYLINCNTSAVDEDQLLEEFTEIVGELGEHDQITIDTSLTYDLEDNSDYGMASQMKLTALIAAGDMDVMVMDQTAYEHYMEVGGFQEFSEIFTEEQMAAWEEYLVTGTDPDDGSEGIYALDVQHAPVIENNSAYAGEKAYAVIVPTGKHRELCDDFLNYLLGL